MFGQVLGDGMDDIAAQPRCLNFAPDPAICGPFSETPIIGNDGSAAVEPKNLAIVNIIGFDNEGDGAIDTLEDAAPNGGDGNNDGILDSTQDYVASFPGSAGNYIVINHRHIPRGSGQRYHEARSRRHAEYVLHVRANTG